MTIAAYEPGDMPGVLTLLAGALPGDPIPPARFVQQVLLDPNFRDVKLAIGDILREAKPKVVVTHWPGSKHKDHTAAAENLPDALFYAALPAFQRALPSHWVARRFFGENWEDLRGYEPEWYLPVLPEDIEQWEKAMRCYALFRGELSSFAYLDYYKALARTRGCEIGGEYAVTFAVPPESRRRRVQSLTE